MMKRLILLFALVFTGQMAALAQTLDVHLKDGRTIKYDASKVNYFNFSGTGNVDYQTVPAAGGTVRKGDITITFPANTFPKETKVAVAEVKKGEVLGDEEVSIL